MPEFNWPGPLYQQHAVDQLAIMLATTRQTYHGTKTDKSWADHTAGQRIFYLEMAERLLIMMGKEPAAGVDLPLNRCATALARKLESVK